MIHYVIHKIVTTINTVNPRQKAPTTNFRDMFSFSANNEYVYVEIEVAIK